MTKTTCLEKVLDEDLWAVYPRYVYRKLDRTEGEGTFMQGRTGGMRRKKRRIHCDVNRRKKKEEIRVDFDNLMFRVKNPDVGEKLNAALLNAAMFKTAGFRRQRLYPTVNVSSSSHKRLSLGIISYDRCYEGLFGLKGSPFNIFSFGQKHGRRIFVLSF